MWQLATWRSDSASPLHLRTDQAAIEVFAPPQVACGPGFEDFFLYVFRIFQNHFHVFSILISLDLGLCNSVFKWLLKLLNVDLHRSLWSCSHVKLGRCLICVVPSLRKEENEYPWSMRGFITNLCARRCWSENDLKEDQTQVYNLKFVDS